MDRFNSNEDFEETPTSIAKDIIYSDGTMDEKVKQIADAIKNEKQKILNDLHDCMKGVVFIDRVIFQTTNYGPFNISVFNCEKQEINKVE